MKIIQQISEQYRGIPNEIWIICGMIALQIAWLEIRMRDAHSLSVALYE